MICGNKDFLPFFLFLQGVALGKSFGYCFYSLVEF